MAIDLTAITASAATQTTVLKHAKRNAQSRCSIPQMSCPPLEPALSGAHRPVQEFAVWKFVPSTE